MADATSRELGSIASPPSDEPSTSFHSHKSTTSHPTIDSEIKGPELLSPLLETVQETVQSKSKLRNVGGNNALVWHAERQTSNVAVSEPQERSWEVDEIKQLQKKVEEKDEQLQSKDEQLQSKDEQLQSKDEQLQSKDEQLQSKDEQLQSKDEQLQSKDEMIKQLQSENELGRQNRLPERRFDDYESKGVLGKGGFGIVYHVLNKTDSCEYALKRIHLPAISRVMREVQALAKLDHPNIVDYSTSWVEKAPVGGKEMPKKWMPLSQSKVTSSSPQYHHSQCSSPQNLTTDSRSSSVVFRDGSQPASHSTTDPDSKDPDSKDPDSNEPPTYLFIQMELCKKESLEDWLWSTKTDRLHAEVMSIFKQIMDAVKYVHSKGMMHRDLKPSNIFFSKEDNVKVGDFGMVTSLEYDLLGNEQQQQHRKQHTGDLGSHFYRSPELKLKQGGEYDQKVDVYSLGVIFFELHCLFDTNMERAKVLEDVNHDKFPKNFENTFPLQAQLVKWMMALNPSERPYIEDVYESEMFRQLMEMNVLDKMIPKL